MSDCENDLIRLRWDIRDAADLLRSASKLAGEISGCNPGRAPNPEFGDPGEEPDPGWSAMAALCDTLADLSDQADLALTPELRRAADDAGAYLDRMADLSAVDSF